jgi:hypothetical protein
MIEEKSPFPYTVYGYFRFHGPIRSPVVAKMIITNAFPKAVELLLGLSENEEIKTIQIHKNNRIILSITRKKDGWASDL